jgi:hypothetical protein
MPMRWVTRRDVEGREVAPPLRCFVEGALVAEPGLRTVGQCVIELVAPDETCLGTADKRPVMKDGKLVGYIDISR